VRKATLVGNFGRRIETAAGLAGYLSGLALQGVPLDEVKRYSPALDAVDAGQVQTFGKTLLDPAQATVVVAGDAKLFLEPLRKRFPDLQVIPAAGIDLDHLPLK
jgi:zinc protease